MAADSRDAEVRTGRSHFDAEEAAAEALAGWRERLERGIEQTLRRRRARAEFRQDHTERRRHGLRARYAAKLARINPPTTTQEDDQP